jgi:predicted permease
MEHLARDLRQALRTVAAMPLQASVIVLSLAVGIGANTTVFSFIQSRVLQPLPGVHDPSGLQLVEPRADTGSYPGTSWPEFRDLARRLGAFQELVAFRMQGFAVGDPAQVERISGLLVSGNYFSVLGVRPVAGRLFTEEDTRVAGATPGVVVSYAFWRDRFGASPQALGRTLRVNGQLLTIVGVTPPQFEGTVIGLTFDLWVPATMAPLLLNGSRELEDRQSRGYQVAGRLQRTATLAHAQAELDAAMHELALAHPESNGRMRADVLPLWQSPRGPQRMLAGALAVLQAIMVVLWLAICANTTTLLLARASVQRSAITLRVALGARPRDITRLVLAETLVLSALAVVCGGMLALWGSHAISSIPLTSGFPLRTAGTVDLLTWGFAAALGAASALVVAAAPAVRLCKAHPRQALADTPVPGSRWHGRQLLMGFQAAVAVAVIVAGGFFARALQQTQDLDPGFDVDGVLLGRYDLSGRSISPPVSRDFAERLLAGVRAIPGIENAAIAQQVPLDIHGLPLIGFRLQEQTDFDAAPPRAASNVVSPGYFDTMRIPILTGSDFVPLGDQEARRQVLVNRAFVARYLADREPLGRAVEVGGREYVIRGVVADSVADAFGEPPMPCIYFSYRDRPSTTGQLHVRARRGDARSLAGAIRTTVSRVDAAVPLYDVRTLAEHVDTNLGLRKIPARIFLILGPFMALLTGMGLYGLVAYAVAQRQTEIGIRLALGATRRHIVREMLWGLLRVVTLGLVVGSGVAYAASARIAGGPVEGEVVFAASLLLFVMCALAAGVPACRLSRAHALLTRRTP